MAEQEEKPAEKKEEEQPTTLESVVKESSELGKASLNTLLGASIFGIGGATYFFGLDGLVTAASFPIGGMIESRLMKEPKPFTSKNFRDESITGALFTVPLWYGFEIIKQVPKVFRLDDIVTANILGASVSISPTIAGLTFGVLTPVLTALYYPLKYAIQNRTFKGISKDFKDNYFKGLIKTSPLTALTSAFVGAAYATPYLAPYLFPAIAVANVLYRVLLSKEKLNYVKLLNPWVYIPKFANPFYVASGVASAAGKVYRNATTAIYDIGSAVRDWFRKTPAPAIEPKPA